MRIIEHKIEAGETPIVSVDAKWVDDFISLTADGRVVANDFQIELPLRRRPLGQDFIGAHIKRLAPERFLLANSRYYGRSQAVVFGINGNEIDSFHIGGHLSEIQVFPERIAVIYSEETIFGGRLPEKSGLAVFSFEGEQIWGFNDLTGTELAIQHAIIADIMPMCSGGSERLFFLCGLGSSLLGILDLRDFKLELKEIPQDVWLATAFSTLDNDEVLFYESGSINTNELKQDEKIKSTGEKQSSFFWWAKDKDIIPIPRKYHGRLTGLYGGKFLGHHDSGFLILSPLEY